MPRRPNVLFVMTDHTNARATAPGSPCLTPCLDALAADGLRFSRACTPNAICSPARASLMTGTYPSTHGVWDCTHTQRREWVDVRGGLAHWAQRLAGAGYRNGYFGKWHVEQSGRLDELGWHEHDVGCSGMRAQPEPGTELVVETEGYRDCLLAAVGRPDTPEHHPAFDRGVDFIRRAAAADAPWCCFISASEPHDPYIPPPRFWDMYDADAAPLPASLRDACEDKPEAVRRMAQVWAGMSDDERAHFTETFSSYVAFVYAGHFRKFDGDIEVLRAAVSIKGVEDVGAKGVLVHSEIRPTRRVAISVDWLISDLSGEIAISDLIVEGISLAVTQREIIGGMFAARDGDVNKLIADLEQQQAKADP